MGSEWLSAAEASRGSGLRLVLTVGVPGPWGEAAKGVLYVKGLSFAKVIQEPAQENPDLVAWTGEKNAPQLVPDDGPPLNRWNDIVLFAERAAHEPALIPSDARDRATMFGLIHEVAGEEGFGWARRLMLLAPIMGLDASHPARQSMGAMANRYGWSEAAAARAPARAAEVVRLIGSQLEAQQQRGREYLVGDALSALDIYWATFAAMIEPLPEDVCAMPVPMRMSYGMKHPELDAAISPALLEHRTRVYERHLELPIDLGPE